MRKAIEIIHSIHHHGILLNLLQNFLILSFIFSDHFLKVRIFLHTTITHQKHPVRQWKSPDLHIFLPTEFTVRGSLLLGPPGEIIRTPCAFGHRLHPPTPQRPGHKTPLHGKPRVIVPNKPSPQILPPSLTRFPQHAPQKNSPVHFMLKTTPILSHFSPFLFKDPPFFEMLDLISFFSPLYFRL